MDQIDYKILLLIADGQYHSGQKLAAFLSSSRAALNKRIAKINLFLEQTTQKNYFISSTTNRGYCLNKPFDGLQVELIQNNLDSGFKVELCPVIDSTNNYLISKNLAPNQFHVCLAELQTAGRGRNTISKIKNWQTPFGNNISCSIAWQYAGNQSALIGLSVIAGITVAEVLTTLGCQNVGLKWPNDIFITNKKVAGILTEILGEPNGYCKLIIGIGINVFDNFSQEHMMTLNQQIQQPWTNVISNLATDRSSKITRNQIITDLLNQFATNYHDFIINGLSMFLQRWNNYDILQNKIINIDIAGKIKFGTALGIDNQGALLVNIDGVKQVFHSGEVSVAIV